MVPRCTVQFSRNTLLSPIRGRCARRRTSCPGNPSPMEVCWKILLPRPILVGPFDHHVGAHPGVVTDFHLGADDGEGADFNPLPMTADSWTMAVSWMMAV